MPIRRSHVRNTKTTEVRQATVTYGDETMPIEYNMGGLSPQTIELLNNPGTSLPAMARMLSEVLIKWEVVDDDGTVLPITKDTLMEFPVDFLSALGGAITDAVKVPKENTSSFKTG